MRTSCIVALVLLGTPSLASAETLETDRFEPERNLELLGLQGIDVDTNWQPPGSPIQVRFETHADDDIFVEMPGDAVLDWDTGELYFVGDDEGGVWDVDIGVTLDARFRFDLVGIQFESSFIGPYDLGIFETAAFTPYLLPGNDQRPVYIDDETTPIEVFNYAIVDAVIASGNFYVDASFDIDMQLACERIDVMDAEGNPVGSITAELEGLAIAGPDEEQDEELVEAQASLHCTLFSDVELILYPGVELQIGFEEFQLAPFELRIQLLDDRIDPLNFDALPIVFDEPPVEEPPSTTGGEGESSSGGDGGGSSSAGASQGDSASGSESSGSGTDGEGVGSTEGSSSGGGPDEPTATDGAQGCGCSSTGSAAPLWMLLGFALIRRRRN
ncbi:MAG: MYXO-CTERM sorting domain-containing protein [Nannocystaceae bacterium]|nr:MYXO-CTERM sorting domain-containing protein [bacterium]